MRNGPAEQSDWDPPTWKSRIVGHKVATPHSNFRPKAFEAFGDSILSKQMTDSVSAQQTEAIKSPLQQTSGIELSEASVEVRICQTWAELEVFRPQWDDILHSAASSTIFSTPEWLGAWWQSYGAGKELSALLFFATDGELVGLTPLYFDKRTIFGRKFRVLRLVGDGSEDSDNLDFVIRPAYERVCAHSFLSWLRRCDWDICALATLPESSLFAANLLRYLHYSGWPVFEQRSPHSFVSLPESWECYLQTLSPEFRPLLTRYPRRLRAQHQVDVYRSTTVDLEKDLSSLFSLHQRRWQERGQSGVFANPDRRHFYHELATSLMTRGWLEFWLMDLDGTTVAAQFCFRFGHTVYLLQEGFDPRFAKEKVGYALRAAMLQDYIRQGVQRYDFLGGNDPYKARFGAEQSCYLTVEFARPATVGSVYITLNRFEHKARRWAHANLPEPTIRLLRRAWYGANGHH